MAAELATCSACGRPIAAKATRFLFGDARILCAPCLPTPGAHVIVFPECPIDRHYAYQHDHAPLTPTGRQPRGLAS